MFIPMKIISTAPSSMSRFGSGKSNENRRPGGPGGHASSSKAASRSMGITSPSPDRLRPQGLRVWIWIPVLPEGESFPNHIVRSAGRSQLKSCDFGSQRRLPRGSIDRGRLQQKAVCAVHHHTWICLRCPPQKKTYIHYRFPTWWIFHLVNKQNHLKQSQVMTWLTKQAFWVYRQGEDHPLFGIVWRWGIPWYTLKASQSCNFHSECGYWPINLFRDTICSQKTFMFYAFLTYPQPRSLLNSFETLSDSLSPLWPAVLGHFGLWASEMFVVPQTSILIHIIGHLKWGWTPTWSYGSYSTASFQITPACPGPRPFPE